MDAARRQAAVATAAVVAGATLLVLQLSVGVVIGSVAVIAVAVHSGVGLVAAVMALLAVKAAAAPAAPHGKAEGAASTIEALLIFMAAAWLVYEAVKKLLHPEPLDGALWGVGVLLVSAVVDLALSHRLFTVGRETGSAELQADAWHLRAHVYTSAGVMAALTLIRLGRVVLPGRDLGVVDAVAAIVVALLVLKATWELTLHDARGGKPGPVSRGGASGT